MSQINLISECFIRPEFEPDESKSRYHLSVLHLSLLPMNYIHNGYLFKKPNNYSASSYFERLKLTLSQALIHFYPLAGRLETHRYEDEHSCCIYVDCSKGPGAKIIHASASHVTIHDIVSPNSDVPDLVRYMFDLGENVINHDGHIRPLLSVQVTELADGFFFGISANHSVVDGTSYTHFHKVWSHIFMGLSSASSLPLPIIRESGLPDEQIVKLPYLNPSEFITTRSGNEIQLRERFFHLTASCMRKLKAKANTEATAVSSISANISSFKVMSAFIWRCITRARDLPSHEVTTCALPVNLRSRLNPALSQENFGNYYTRVKVCAKVGEVLENNLGWAAMLLHQALLSLDEEAAARAVFTEDFNEGPGLLVPSLSANSNDVVVAGSPWYDVYGPEFGLGAAVALRGGPGNKWDGKVNCYAGSEGVGSVELEMCLAPDTLTSLLSDEEFMSFALEQIAGMHLASRL